jgi:antitoxin (DNA-binding transcriptional repressor) of toxin-antitoxin stability system
MGRNVTATEAARHFSELLNRVRYEGETFVILRGGEAVGQLGPVESHPGTTFRDLIAALNRIEKPDEGFADDLEKIQAGQPLAGESPWPS